ncbi:MAG: uncharacterized protein K0S65_6217 [Labilithrix sp.]|nr:uncharacterized protein [Labilithrix sp.]
MDLSFTTVRILVEAAEGAGIPENALLEGLVEGGTLSPKQRVPWATFVAVADRLASLVDNDPERIRAIGALSIQVPSYAFLQRLARDIVSLPALYVAGARWLAPSTLPHLPLSIEVDGDRWVRFEGSVPEPYAACVPFFYMVEGCASALPRLLGLPPARIVSSEMTPRHLVTVLELPPSPASLGSRVKRSLKSFLSWRGQATLELLDRQRRELEESVVAMRRASEEVQRLLEGLPDPVVIHRDGTILWVNRMLLKTLAYDEASELVGKPLITLLHESSVKATLQRMRTPIGAQPELTEVRLKRRDGEIVIAECPPTQRIVFGGVEARLVVGRDVTERFRMQERLVTADRLSSLGLLAAGVAHEINNPLAYVLGSIENARRSIERASPEIEPALEALATALEGVDRVRTIVRDLRTFSRDEQGVEAVDVRAVLDSTLTLAGIEIQGRARVVRDYLPVPDARVNAARLGQVFLNLMVNALESMPDAPHESELRVRTSTDPAGKPIVEVSDTGSGIPPELLDRIFDPFFTTKPTGQGTGLGLAICHRIISEAGGDISVRSTPGRGSTFRLTLPPAR